MKKLIPFFLFLLVSKKFYFSLFFGGILLALVSVMGLPMLFGIVPNLTTMEIIGSITLFGLIGLLPSTCISFIQYVRESRIEHQKLMDWEKQKMCKN